MAGSTPVLSNYSAEPIPGNSTPISGRSIAADRRVVRLRAADGDRPSAVANPGCRPGRLDGSPAGRCHRVSPRGEPPRLPNLNAYAERFVRSIKDECLNRMIFFGERSLRKATLEYTAHYHAERNHQGLDNRLIEPDNRVDSTLGALRCVQRLGGMLRFYHRAAA